MKTDKTLTALITIFFLLFNAFNLAEAATREIADTQTTNPVLTVASNPGGCVIVTSSEINNGGYVIVDQGQEQSWELPVGTNVTLLAAYCSVGIGFNGFGMNGPNPMTIQVTSSITIRASFWPSGAPNGLMVTLAGLTRAGNNLQVDFNVTNSYAPYDYMKEIYGVTLYLDKNPVPNLQWSESSSDLRTYCQFTTYIPMSMVEKGNHSFYVVAKTSFYKPSPDPAPWVPDASDGSGISNMMYYKLESNQPANQQNNNQTTDASSQNTVVIASVVIAAVVIIIATGILKIKRK
jgi:hypothetical protein